MSEISSSSDALLIISPSSGISCLQDEFSGLDLDACRESEFAETRSLLELCRMFVAEAGDRSFVMAHSLSLSSPECKDLKKKTNVE